MSFYDDMAATALKLLKKFGKPVTLKRTVGEVINPVTGAVTPGSGGDQTTTGLLKRYPDNLIDGTRIQSGDRMAVLSAEVEPLMTDRLVIGEEEWEIHRIETVKPTDTPIVYFVQVRK